MRSNLDMDTLRTFVLGFDLGSFARAARRIGRSQSAVSTQLRKLEEQVGQALVKKSGRGLVPTPAGEDVLVYARRILALNDEVIDLVRGSNVEGRVRLGLPQDFAESWLPDVLGRFARTHPRLKVEVRVERTNVLLEKVTEGELDLALAWGNVAAHPAVEHVADLPMIWAGHADWPGVQSLKGEPLPLIAFDPPCSFREAGIMALNDARIAWRLAFSSPSLSGLWAAAAAGLGVTMRTRVGLPSAVSVLRPSQTGLPDLPAAPLSLFRIEPVDDPAIGLFRDILLEVVLARITAAD